MMIPYPCPPQTQERALARPKILIFVIILVFIVIMTMLGCTPGAAAGAAAAALMGAEGFRMAGHVTQR
jgi:hypothetical protein